MLKYNICCRLARSTFDSIEGKERTVKYTPQTRIGVRGVGAGPVGPDRLGARPGSGPGAGADHGPWAVGLQPSACRLLSESLWNPNPIRIPLESLWNPFRPLTPILFASK